MGLKDYDDGRADGATAASVGRRRYGEGQRRVSRAPGLGLGAQAQAVMDAVEKVVLAEVHGNNEADGEHPDAHGIAVYIPQTTNEYNDKYDLTDFAADTFWDEFIKAYFLI